MAETLAAAGFGGIYLDRYGYSDQGAKLEGELAELLGAKPIVSGNGRLAVFDLAAYHRRLREKYAPPEWEARREAALHPLLPVWRAGFSDPEGTPENNWRWCTDEGELQLTNRSQKDKRVALEMSLAAGSEANLQIRSPFFSERLRIGPAELAFSRPVTVPPGVHTVRFDCDARRILTPVDYRHLVFRVHNFRLRSLDD
jgi:phosphoglycerol transferase